MPESETLADADVIVVGGGISGWCTAFELNRRNFDVVVVEQRFSTYGASGRNPGSLWIQFRRAGEELLLARAGARKYQEYLEEFGGVFEIHQDGGLLFFESEEQGRVLETYVTERRAAGVEVELLSRDAALKRSALLPDTALGAVFCPEDQRIDTVSFVNALAARCVARGVRKFENTAVLATIRRGDGVTGVRTVRGDIRAAGVVWATGAWATNLRSEGLEIRMRTSRMGHSRTQPVGVRSHAVMHGPRGVAHCGALTDLPGFDASVFAAPVVLPGYRLDYDDSIAQHADGGVYVGSTIDGYGSLNPHISVTAAHGMTSVLLDRYGSYGGLGIIGLWAGLSCETADHLPIVDRLDGVYLNTGHAWGVASGPACGELLAQVIAGEPGENSGLVPRLRADRPSLTH